MEETLKSLKSFAVVDAAAGRWRGARGPLAVLGDDGKVKVNVSIADMVKKREQVMRHSQA